MELPRRRLVRVGDGRTLSIVDVARHTPPADIVAQLQFACPPRGVVSVSGGASAFPTDAAADMARLVDNLVHVAFEHRLMLVDGGTAAGVMHMLGVSYAAAATTRTNAPPLLGFVPSALVTHNGNGECANLTPIEPHHPFIVMVQDGKAWGDEVDCMSAFIQHIAQRVSALTIVANGGLITLAEVEQSVRRGTPVLLLEGSQRCVALIRAAVAGSGSQQLEQLARQLDPSVDTGAVLRRVMEQLDVIRTGDIHALPLTTSADDFVRAVLQHLCLGIVQD
jgi:hypothetical protein